MARRITQSSVNWAAISERVHPSQRLNFNAFKSKSDKYLRAVMANPETPPKIDWAFYKKNIVNKAMVDQFQKGYEGLKVPFPSDPLTSQVVAQEANVKVEIDQFKKESAGRIAGLNKEKAHLNSLLPYDQMTMEDFRDAHPELALDPLNRPTLWPHTPEEQPGYEGKETQASSH